MVDVILISCSEIETLAKIQPVFYYSKQSLKNIILNFCMFVPLGFWLPIGLKKFRSCWFTYFMGFVCTLTIEITQLLFGIGIFEFGDLLGNTVGVMIGYGLFGMVNYIRSAIKEKKQTRKFKHTLMLQLPLLISLTVFGIIFAVYTLLEIGTNPYRSINPYDRELIRINSKVKFKDKDISLSQLSFRESENAIRVALEQYNIIVPKGCKFEIFDDGRYRFTASMIETNEGLINGTLDCTYYGKDGMGKIDNFLYNATPYKEYAAITEQEAYEKLKNGEFEYFGDAKLDIQVKESKLVYVIDCKGYYQPTYQFNCLVNGEERELNIPALN